MLANRTGRRSILTPVHITAVTALPLRLLLALEYRSVDNPFVKTAVTFFMFDLHFSYHAESSRNLRKALFVGHLREIGIEFPHSSSSPSAAASRFSAVVPITPAG